jgi:D-alanyl-D-alanine carboxypeptidase
MLKRAAVLLALLAAALTATAAPVSETPALQVFKQWLDAFNSGDSARITAFWQKYGRGGADDRVAGDLRLRTMTGGMTIYRVEEDTDTHLVALMKENRGVFSESTLDLASVNPPAIAGMMGHPVAPPEGSGNPVASDDQLADRVQTHLAAMNGPDAFSGAILIAHHDNIVLEHAWGMADESNHVSNTIDTQFCIGSMNKMFTAVAILQLVGQGKLALDKPIAAYWPDYPNPDLASRVTIRELLNHTGGTGDIFTPEYQAHREKTRTLADYIELFGSRPVAFEPGSRMEYSNYGFILLGRIIELVSGESYERYVQEHIYHPAGMMHTDSRPEADHVNGRAIGYTRGPHGTVPNTDGMPWSGTSAGGGYSTVRDLFHFAEALQSGKLLGAELLREATQASAMRRDYGMGFYVLPDGGYGHGGGAPGINGELHILPHDGYVLVALANRDPRMASNMVDFMTSILPVHKVLSDFFHPRDVTELAHRRGSCLLRGHAAVDVVLGFDFEMVANVLLEIRQHAFAPCHPSPCSPGRRICAMARASLSHFPVSTANCCLPLGVNA